MLYPRYLSRDRTYAKINARPHVVEAMSWDVLGGPQTATITTEGGPAESWTLTGWLRSPVMITDIHGRRVWWGFVNEVLVSSGVTELGLTLDGMANTVSVAYSYVSPGTNEVGNRKTTTAVTDADSITEYGTREMIVSQSGMTDAAATALATRYLADHKTPQRVFTPGGTGRPYGFAPAPKSPLYRVTLNCKGWWSTLDWRYANVSKVGPSATVSTGTVQNLGNASANTKVLQQFTVGSTGIYVVGATVRILKTGTPADNLTMEVYALDGSGNPTGTALLTGSSISGSLIDATTAQNLRDDFTTPVTLTAGVQYGLVYARSGAVDGSNYYRLLGDSGASYAGGATKLWNGSAWGAALTWDSYFRINVNPLMETTQQIKDLITTYGQFFAYTDIVTASGVSTGANKDGDSTVLAVIEDLLSHGGPNDRRMIAQVIPTDTETMVLSANEEEASSSYAFYQDGGGRILTTGGTPVPPYMPPVGRWVKIKDAIPSAGDTGLLADATLQFMEGADWSLSSGLSPRYRGQPDVSDIVRLAGTGGY